jgi:putative transposase
LTCTPKVGNNFGGISMTKISWDTKIAAIEEYLTGTTAKTAVAKKFGISITLFKIMVGIYELYGRKELMNPPEISGTFRIKLVKWKQLNNASIAETCIHFALMSSEAVVRWERLYLRQGEQALVQMHKGRSKYGKRKFRREDPAPRVRELILADTKRRLKKIGGLEKATKKQLSQEIIALKAKYRLIDLIAALPIGMSTFQYWQNRFNHPDPADLELTRRINQAFTENHGNYGVRRISPIIRKQYALEGRIQPNHKKIQRIMFEQGLKCTKYSKRIRKYDSSKGPQNKIAKNRLHRHFTSNRLFQKMVCDVTELRAKNGDKVYLEVIKDLCSRRIIEWEISTSPDLKFSLAPLNRLIQHLPHHTGYLLTLHTDQGWQYQHRFWRRLLRKGHIRQSMSRRSTCLDNAACETVFNKLKAEIEPSTAYETGAKLRQAITEWIAYYNTTRIQTKLGNQSPLEFERQLVA